VDLFYSIDISKNITSSLLLLNLIIFMNNNLNILQSSGLYIEYYGSDLDNKFG